jgi:preprotein translocase subunit SecE
MAKTALAPTDQTGAPKSSSAVEWVKGHYENSRTFFGDVRAEMRKVVTPSRKEVQATTTVVLVTVFIFAGYFFVVDYAFSNGVAWVIARLAGPQ